MEGATILVTGGAGFVGSHVVDRALREGATVYCLDNLYTGRRDNFAHHVGHPRFHFVSHDVRHPFPAEVLALKLNFIFHLACAASPVHYQADPIGTTLTCVNGTAHALELAQQNDCPVLIASTSEVYGDPTVHPQTEEYWGNVNCTGIRSCYDEGKRCGEALSFDFYRKFGVKVRVARIFNTYGPRMCFNDGRIISNFIVQALRGQDITVYGDGSYTRSFQYVADLVEGFWRLIQHPTETGPVNLGNPVEYTVLEMAKRAQALVPECKSKIIFLPPAADDPKQRKPDISKAARVLGGWAPKIALAEGLALTHDEFAARVAAEAVAHERIYIQCNPLLDISAHVDAAFLDKYGIKPASAGLVTDEQMPIYADLEAQPGVTFIPGGSGLNTARVAQWVSRAPHNSLVSYVGCVADDKYGETLRRAAERDGVRMVLQYTDKAPTGSCAVCVTGTERALVANLGAANCITAEHLDTPFVRDAARESKLFYLSGFTLTIDVAHVLKAAQRAHAVGGKFLLNLSAPFIVQFFGSQLAQVLPFVDILFSNDDEARAYAAANNYDTTDVPTIAKRLAEAPHEGPHAGKRLVVFTCGAQPTVYATPTTAGSVPVKPVEKIVDTNGAGDAFVGGFIAALARNCSVEQCINVGNYAAGVVIQHDGCTFPPTPEITF